MRFVLFASAASFVISAGLILFRGASLTPGLTAAALLMLAWAAVREAGRIE